MRSVQIRLHRAAKIIKSAASAIKKALSGAVVLITRDKRAAAAVKSAGR